MNEWIKSNQLIRKIIICISIILIILVIFYKTNVAIFFGLPNYYYLIWPVKNPQILLVKKTHGQNGYVQHDLTKMITWLGWILSLLCGFLLVFLTK